uniref:Bet v I/Major latex protein domain-containing protein n=1 Tax=Brassica campestris TaxID=3711 RepID=M4EDD3_BRACM
MAMSGTYVTEVPLKGSAKNHYRRWRSENHLFPDAVGHHIQGVKVHEGDWDSHGAIKSWNYTCDGKQEVFKEKREFDDDKMAVTFRGLEGHVMEQLKVYDVIFQFIPKAKQGCICKITMISFWLWLPLVRALIPGSNGSFNVIFAGFCLREEMFPLNLFAGSSPGFFPVQFDCRFSPSMFHRLLI